MPKPKHAPLPWRRRAQKAARSAAKSAAASAALAAVAPISAENAALAAQIEAINARLNGWETSGMPVTRLE